MQTVCVVTSLFLRCAAHFPFPCRSRQINRGPADLALKHFQTLELRRLQRSELSPGGELRFDGECD